MAMPERTRDLVTRGAVTIEVIAEGQGPLIVLLPSSSRDSEDMDEVAAMIAAAGFRVLRPQPRGMGRSRGPMQDLDLHALAADVAFVIDAQAAGPAVLIGHAFGQFVARMTAVDHPRLVRGVVIAAGAAKNADPELRESLRAAANTSLSAEERLKHLRIAFFAPAHDPSSWLDGWHPELAPAYMAAAQKPPKEVWWSGGSAPMLDLQAELDPWRPPETRSQIKDEFGDRVTVTLIPDASHALFPEQPERTVQAIVSWVRGLEYSSPERQAGCRVEQAAPAPAAREFSMAITSAVDQVTADLTRLRFLFVNLYYWGTASSWVLIDAGLQGSMSTIVETAEERFGRGTKPQAIILTHGHFDHVGAFPELFERWDVPVYAHSLELPHVTGRTDYPPPDPTVGKGAMALMSFAYPNEAIDLGARAKPLPEDGSVPHMPDWRWIHTPGHTAGHVSLFRERDRCLIAGDAFVTVKQESLYAVATQEQEIHGPPAYFTPGWRAARQSVERLAALRPAIAATGHGTPMSGEALSRGLEKLVREFDEIAVPDQGR